MTDVTETIPGMDLPIEWSNTVVEAMTALWTKVAVFIPNLLGAFIIVIIGYFLSLVLARLTTTILRKVKFETASEKTGLDGTLSRVGIKSSASEIVGKLVFWLFMLTILISASETLGLENVSRTINTFVEYLPNVIAAALIVVLGLLLAHFVRTVVETAAEGLGFGYARAVSRLAYIVLIAVVGILAIDQLGIETGLLDRVVEIILIAAGAALAIALGLGTRGVAKSIVSGVYARDLYKSGSKLQVLDYEGTVDSVGSITTSIRTQDGELIHIPNDHLLRNVVRENTS